MDTAVLVRAGGSALLALAGIVALALSRGNKGALALGVTLTAWGAQLVGQNLFTGDAADSVAWGSALAFLIALRAAGMLGLVFLWPTPLRAHERRAAALAIAVGILALVLTLADAAFAPISGTPTQIGLYVADRLKNAVWASLSVLLPLRYLATAPEEGSLRRTLAWGGILLFTWFAAAGDLLRTGQLLGWATVASPLGVASTFVSAALWLAATRHADGKPARLAAHGILALTLAGLALRAWYADLPVEDAAIGVQRAVFAFLLVYAMMRLGFLGHDVTFRTARRGTLAAAALALIFVVAQVAQNFLAAQYGLLMGGVVAGAFLFAAQPLQRAFEGRTSAPGPDLAPAPDDERVAVFRDAARRSVRDGVVTRDEELHLSRLARHLGLPHEVATRVRHEVEDEARIRHDDETGSGRRTA